ncbi:MAG: thioredoxin family protein [Thermoproteus sp.]
MEFILAADDQALDEALARCRLAVVFFSGRQCAVCINFERMLRSICRSYKDICCIKAYSESVIAHVKQLGVAGVPSLVGYVDGRPVARAVGLPYAPAVNMFMTSLLRAAYG